jgi:hypothetical protein
MKIYATPEEVPTPEFDYSNYDAKKIEAQEDQHKADLKKWIISMGYDKPLTGEILREPVADGYAQYMVADGGRQWALIHLEYGDAYHSRNVEFLTKAEVKKRIQAAKDIRAMFKSKSKAA